MFLKSIEMFGFKSFPERTRLDFTGGITVVVGPNGCGKSNICDAVRWVFGERSSKAMRGKKMEDVIFAGADGRPASGFAEVSLFLDNTDRGLDIEEDEVCITRRIYRSGETEYLINKKNVRLADLLEMFMDTGLGRDGYSLIGQGRISEIVAANSRDRREIFEEAAGISKHRFRREEAERSLEKANDNMLRLTDIMSELESRIEPLRLAAEKAEKYIALVGEKTGLELGVWLSNLNKNENALKKISDDLTAVEAQISESEIKAAGAQREMDGIFAASQSYNVIIDAKRRESETLQHRCADIRSKIELCRADFAHRRADVERMNGQIGQYEAMMSDSDRMVQQYKDDIKAREKGIEDAKTEVAQIEAGLAELNASEGGKQQRYEQLFAEIEAATRRLNDVRIARVQTESEAGVLADKLTESEQALQSHSGVVGDMKEEAELLAEDAAQIASDIEKRNNARSGLEIKAATLANKVNILGQECSALKVDADGCRHKAQTLEDMEKQMEGYAGSVKAVMARAAAGSLRGIRGTVAQLISVEGKYAVAVEIALGGALQDIVTENEEQAKYAINYLKTNNLGRATFLPMSAVSGETMSAGDLSGCEGWHGVASALVKTDPQYSRIIGKLLGRTAVFEDMDTAIAASKKTGYRYRIVTLDGQLINSGGSMTGGSLNKNSGTLSRAGQISDYRARASELEAQLAAKNTELENAGKELAAVRGQLDSDAETMSGLAAEKMRIDMSLAQANRDYEQTKDAIKILTAAVKDIKAAIAQNEKANAAQRLDEQVAAELLEKKNAESRELSDGRTDFFTRREAILESISAKKLQIAEYMKDIGLLNNNIELAGADKQQKQMLIAGVRAQIAAAESGDSEQGGELETLQGELDSLNASIEACSRDIEQTAAERDANEMKMNAVREKDKEIALLRQNLAAESARLTERAATARREYDNTVARLWDEYELTREDAAAKAIPIENTAEATRQLNRLREKIRSLGTVNTAAGEEYAEVSERYTTMKTQYDDIVKSQKELEKLISSLNATMTEMFTKTFNEVNTLFQEVFVELFGGGQAKLRLEDENNVLDCGIEISAQPPGKSIKNLESLSGGEQSFLAVAIYFAILKVKPTPFCILDEIESALDEVNVRRLADYMQAMCGATQFISITHRRGTMEIADTLYGVTMQKAGASSGVSKVLRLNIGEIEEKLGIKV